MAKGQSQKADTQLGKTNQIGSQELGTANALESQLAPEYTSMLNAGYSPAQQSAMTTEGMGAVGSSFDAAGHKAVNEAAKTGNASNLTAQEDQLARDSGVAKGNEAAGLQKSFADREQQNRDEGLQGLSGLYGSQLGAGTSMYGLSPGLLSARAQGQNTGLDIAKMITGGAGAAIAG